MSRARISAKIGIHANGRTVRIFVKLFRDTRHTEHFSGNGLRLHCFKSRIQCNFQIEPVRFPNDIHIGSSGNANRVSFQIKGFRTVAIIVVCRINGLFFTHIILYVPLSVLGHNTVKIILKRCGRTVIIESTAKILCTGRSHGIKKDIVIETVVSAINKSHSLDVCGMRVMIRRGTFDDIVTVNASAKKIVYVSTALSGIQHAHFRTENIVIHKMRTVCYLEPDILDVVMIDVGADSHALRLPVQPRSHGAIVDFIVMNLRIECRVKLDSRNFITEKFIFDANIINLVPVNLAECAAEMSDNAVLTAIVNDVVTDNMRTDGFAAPSHTLCGKHGFELILISRFSVIAVIKIVARGKLLANAHGTAAGVMENIVFDDPAFGPMRTEDSRLFRGGGRPGRCALRHFKTADGDIIQSCFFRIETAFAYVDFYKRFIGIRILEIHGENGFLLSNLCRPDHFIFCGRFQGIDLTECFSVKIDLTCVAGMIERFLHPVAIDFRFIRIVISKHFVVHGSCPCAVFVFCPTGQNLRTFDHGTFSLSCRIHDPFPFVSRTVFRFYPLTVNTFVNDNGVALIRKLCRTRDGQKRIFFRAVRTVVSVFRNMIFSCHNHKFLSVMNIFWPFAICIFILTQETENINGFSKILRATALTFFENIGNLRV